MSEAGRPSAPSTPPRHDYADDGGATGPLAWMARNSVAANVITLLVLAVGAVMLFQVRQEVFPEIDFDTITIGVAYPGASPEEVEQGVVLAIEEAVQSIDGVKEVRSSAGEGMAVVAVELQINANADRVLADVQSAVDRITSFPADAERPIVSLALNRPVVLSLVLYGDQSEHVLRDLAESTRRDLLEDDRISLVNLSGVRPIEISISVPSERLREHNLTIDGIAQRIRDASVELPGGAVKARSGEILLRTAERRDRAEEFGDIELVSRPDGTRLFVRDVADVEDGFREIDQEAYFNGQRAVMLDVHRVGDETPTEVSEAVHDHVERLRRDLPAGVHADVWSDTSESYRGRMELLRDDALVGLILILIVLGLFLEPQLAFWVTLGIPVSLAGAVMFLPVFDVSINMISLFAFLITTGVLVDDAIVIGEAVYQQRERGVPYLRAAIAGVKEVAGPVTFSILTACIAFTPLLFVPGTMGKFFRLIPIIVITVLLVSLAEALFCLPAHLAHRMPGWLRVLLFPFLFPMGLLHKLRFDQRLHGWVDRFYRPLVRLCLRWRYVTVAVGVGLLVFTAGYVAGGREEILFIPRIEGDVVTASVEMPIGTPVDETRAVVERIEEAGRRVLAAQGHGKNLARGMFAQVGTASSGGMGGSSESSSGSHLATVRIYLVPPDDREIGSAVIAEAWREAVGDVPGVDTLAFRSTIASASSAGINVRLSHPDPEVLHTAAARLAETLHGFRGLKNIDDGFTAGKEQLDLHIRPEARALGLTETDLARQVRSAFFGAEALRQQRGRDEVRVFVRLPERERRSLHDLESLVVRTAEGGEVPLAEAAFVERGHAYTEISRTGGRRTIDVTADIVPGQANADQVLASVTEEELPRLLADYPHLSYQLGGQQQERAEGMRSLGIGFFLAMFVMFAFLAVALRSYLQPAIVMSVIPFGIVGAVWGHVVMGYELSIMSMFGIVALSGMVVNDSIVLVDAVNRFRQDTPAIEQAVVDAGARRFRAIMLVSSTTFIGLAPIVLETSVQARFLVPMGISLAFGAVFSTTITLLVLPCLYLILEDVKAGGRWVVDLYRPRPAPAEPPSEPAPGE